MKKTAVENTGISESISAQVAPPLFTRVVVEPSPHQQPSSYSIAKNADQIIGCTEKPNTEW